MFFHLKESAKPLQAPRLAVPARHELGASAIEFALIIPFLLMLAGGIVEMANLYFVRSQINEIARDATRRLALDALSQDQARKFILDQLSQTTDAKGKVTITETKEKKKGEVSDVTIEVELPLREILIFDVLADMFVTAGEGSPDLSVSVTMLKH